MTDIFSKRLVVLGKGKRECGVCGKIVSDNTLARSAHGKTHVAEGTATAVTEWVRGVRQGEVKVTGTRTRFVFTEAKEMTWKEARSAGLL